MEGRRTEIVSLLLTVSPTQGFDEQDVVENLPIAHSMLKPLWGCRAPSKGGWDEGWSKTISGGTGHLCSFWLRRIMPWVGSKAAVQG